ncbi:hypothetical protein AURDEDRAFT_174410 [Auricularia subglabra TFB-10046 SS5]|uniref:Uncharacterized protein n=1 Tax=Auricularia subglabra (strain TFB-10046 / SS5) TaxID=717982 RepID=J0D9R2_AURST|nr:hypothetical protein AURDEDRAFT_174410 [Auricularia subglabra TFB-10046 SS5]
MIGSPASTERAVGPVETSLATICRDPFDSLFPELLASIFGQLDFQGRLYASHVSPAWRTVALSARSLWNEFELSGDRSFKDSNAEALSALLARSDPLPFHLSCDNQLPDAVAELTIRNMHRMETVELVGITPANLIQLLGQDAPLLKRFSYFGSAPPDAPPAISERWACPYAPQLQEIQLSCVCRFPSGCVFDALRSFTAAMPQQRVGEPLSTMLPNLKNLTLHDLTQEVLATLFPLPSSIEFVALWTHGLDALDYSGLIEACEAPALRTLRVGGARRVSPAVRPFFRVTNGHWTLLISSGGSAVLRTPARDALYQVSCARTSVSLVNEPAIIDHLDTLCELTLPLPTLMGLICADAWDRRLPALVDITTVCSEPREFAAARGVEYKAVDAPVLESITLRWDTGDNDTGAHSILSLIRAFSAPRLEGIIIQTFSPAMFLDTDLSMFNDVAERLIVHDLRAGEWVEIPLRGSLGD